MRQYETTQHDRRSQVNVDYAAKIVGCDRLDETTRSISRVVDENVDVAEFELGLLE